VHMADSTGNRHNLHAPSRNHAYVPCARLKPNPQLPTPHAKQAACARLHDLRPTWPAYALPCVQLPIPPISALAIYIAEIMAQAGI